MELTHSHVIGTHHLNRLFPEDMNILTHAPEAAAFSTASHADGEGGHVTEWYGTKTKKFNPFLIGTV